MCDGREWLDDSVFFFFSGRHYDKPESSSSSSRRDIRACLFFFFSALCLVCAHTTECPWVSVAGQLPSCSVHTFTPSRNKTDIIDTLVSFFSIPSIISFVLGDSSNKESLADKIIFSSTFERNNFCFLSTNFYPANRKISPQKICKSQILFPDKNWFELVVFFHLRRVFDLIISATNIFQLFGQLWFEEEENQFWTTFFCFCFRCSKKFVSVVISKLEKHKERNKRRRREKIIWWLGRTMMAGRSGVVRSILLIVYLFLLSSGKSLISFSFYFRKKSRSASSIIPFLFMAIREMWKDQGGWCLKIE